MGLVIKALVRAVDSKEVGAVIMEAIKDPAVGVATSKVNKESHEEPTMGAATNKDLMKTAAETLGGISVADMARF